MRKRRDSDPNALEQKIDKARRGEEFDLDYDEVTGIMDILTEQTKKRGEACIEKTRETIEKIKSKTAFA